EADPATPVRDIVKVMVEQVGSATLDVDALHLGDRPLDLTQTLGTSGLFDGSVLSADGPVGRARESRGLVTVRTVAGRGAGAVTRLGVGEFTIGAAPRSPARRDGARPPGVASCTVGLDAPVLVRSVPSAPMTATTTDVELDRAPLPAEPVPWPPGVQLRI